MDEGTNVLLEKRLCEGRELLQTAESVSQVNGLSKLIKRIRREIQFLERRPSQKEHIDCSNLSHLKAILSALKAAPNPTDVLKSFGSDKKITVDVVCDDGLLWIKVVAKNSQALDLNSQGNNQFGQRSILDQADHFVQCASQNLRGFRPPRVQFAFFNGISASLTQDLEERGVQVLGPDLQPLGTPQPLHKAVEGELGGSPDEYLNLDITTMIAYVSALTNGQTEFMFNQPYLEHQGQPFRR